jgi:hypothetical protein
VQSKKLFPLVVAATVLAVGAVQTPALAAPVVSFSRIYVDSPGRDTRTNASLNAEWVRLTNNTSRGIQLRGWTVRDVARHVYTFSTYTLGARKSVYIHTGRGTNGRPDAGHRFWQSGNYIWNNTGDTAILRNAAGTQIDSCSWRTTVATNC